MIILLALLVVLILAGLGFAIHVLWWIALIARSGCLALCSESVRPSHGHPGAAGTGGNPTTRPASAGKPVVPRTPPSRHRLPRLPPELVS